MAESWKLVMVELIVEDLSLARTKHFDHWFEYLSSRSTTKILSTGLSSKIWKIINRWIPWRYSNNYKYKFRYLWIGLLKWPIICFFHGHLIFIHALDSVCLQIRHAILILLQVTCIISWSGIWGKDRIMSSLWLYN